MVQVRVIIIEESSGNKHTPRCLKKVLMVFSLKTREKYVQIAEEKLEAKKKHCEFCKCGKELHC